MATIVKVIDLPKQAYSKIPDLMRNSYIAKRRATDPTAVIQGSEKVIGYERDGSILFTWQSYLEPTGSQTFVGVCYPPTGETSLVFADDKDIGIVNASINQEHSLLAFCLVDKQNNEEDDAKSPIYSTFFVEIGPQNRIFSLNIESCYYKKLQFLYPSTATSLKCSRAVLMHHTQMIGLYTVPLAKLGDGHTVISGQPKTQEILRTFFWCQFDSSVQRLYLAKLAPQDETKRSGSVVFLALQLTNTEKYKFVFEIFLPLTIRIPLESEVPEYHPYFVSDIVSSAELNFCVKESPKGSFFLCYQKHAALSIEEDGDIATEEESKLVTYTIFCLHGGYSISCSVVLDNEWTHNAPPLIQFVPVNDYLCVYACGIFMHLLDCGVEHCPVNNIYLSGGSLPRIPDEDPSECKSVPRFTGGIRQSIPLTHDGSMIFDSRSQIFYKLCFGNDRLVHLFATTHDKMTRLSVLHCAVVHLKDSYLTRKLIECLCQDPANFECSSLIKEYLIAATYRHMRALLGPSELKVFPMTTAEAFRGEFRKSGKGKASFRLSYKQLERELCDLLCRMLRNKDVDTWCLLSKSLQLTSSEDFATFPLKCLEGDQGPASDAAELPSKLRNAKTSLFHRLSRSRLISSKTDIRQSIAADQNGSALAECSEDELSKIAVVLDTMTTHLCKCFPKEQKAKLHSMAVEYCSCRGKILKSLWRNILKSMGFCNETAVLSVDFANPVRNEEMALFQIIERLCVTLSQISVAIPAGLSKSFLTLAVRSLPRHLFLQYLQADVFVVSESVVSRVVTELSDEPPCNVCLKVALLQKLPKEAARQVLLCWDHPVSMRYRAQQTVLRFNGDFTVSSPPFDEVAEAVFEDREFRPVSTLLASLQTGPRVRSSSGSTNFVGLDRDKIQFLHAMSLVESRRLTRGSP